MSAPVVRPATAADATALAAVWEHAWHDAHRGHVPAALIEARDSSYFTERAGRLLAQALVAEDEHGSLVGVVIVNDDEVEQLMVDAAARGHGVGTLLLDAAERGIAAAGHSEVWLAVVPGNASARAFYAERGWVDRGDETYDAVTLDGDTVSVPVRRYVKQFSERAARGGRDETDQG